MTTIRRSQYMADAIEERMVELDISPGQLVKATGLSAPGVIRVRQGEIRSYQRGTTVPICRALLWAPNSIELLLAGEPPIETERPPIVTTKPGTSSVTDDDFLDALNEMRDERREDRRRIKALEDQLRGRGPTGDDNRTERDGTG